MIPLDRFDYKALSDEEKAAADRLGSKFSPFGMAVVRLSFADRLYTPAPLGLLLPAVEHLMLRTPSVAAHVTPSEVSLFLWAPSAKVPTFLDRRVPTIVAHVASVLQAGLLDKATDSDDVTNNVAALCLGVAPMRCVSREWICNTEEAFTEILGYTRWRASAAFNDHVTRQCSVLGYSQKYLLGKTLQSRQSFVAAQDQVPLVGFDDAPCGYMFGPEHDSSGAKPAQRQRKITYEAVDYPALVAQLEARLAAAKLTGPGIRV